MRQGATAGAASAALAAIFLLSAADATQPSLRDVERRRAGAEADRRRLESDARAAAAQIAALNRKLADATTARRDATREVTAVEADLTGLAADGRWALRQSDRARATLEQTLIALSRPDADPQAAAVAAVAGRALATRASLSLAAADRAEIARHDLAARRADLAVAQARLDSAAAAVQDLIAQQQARQALLDSEASRAAQRATSLAQQAQSLRALIARTTQRIAPRTAAAAVPPPRRTTPASVVAAAARIAPSAAVVRRFGARLGHGAAQGLTLSLQPGGQVLAPSVAKVAWAGPFRSYGSVLILDPGGDCAIVFTGIGDILVRAGQSVRPGQPVAQMALDVTSAPELYVEVRRAGDPIDPVPWLNAGTVTNRANVR